MFGLWELKGAFDPTSIGFIIGLLLRTLYSEGFTTRPHQKGSLDRSFNEKQTFSTKY